MSFWSCKGGMYISIHKALASLDLIKSRYHQQYLISIHKALASLDGFSSSFSTCDFNFNPQGSREPRLRPKPSPAPDFHISIHKALASLDAFSIIDRNSSPYFNPQGSREPRPTFATVRSKFQKFQSTRLSRASTYDYVDDIQFCQFQSTRLSRAST